jgi:hypothetical protein
MTEMQHTDGSETEIGATDGRSTEANNKRHDVMSFLKKLIGLQAAKKFVAFYGIQRFITAFTRAHHV